MDPDIVGGEGGYKTRVSKLWLMESLCLAPP